MKNRKSKIANLFKIGTFLLSFSLLLFNCEKESELDVGLVEQHKEVIKLKTLTNSNGIIDNLLNDFENKNIIDNTKKSKTFDGYTIDNSVVKYIENIETGYHSYTFNIRERVGLNFKNLLLSYDLTTNSYKKYLVNYNLDINEIVNFYNTKQISIDKISMIETPNSSNKSKQKVSQMKTECAVISTYDFCMEGNHPGGFDGGVRCPAFAQIVISTCEAGGSSPTGGDSTGDDIEISSGGGTGFNSYQNNTYVDATVPILSLGETIANELHNIIGLTSSEYKWLSDEKNIEETLDILSFLNTNKNPDNTYPEETTNFAKLAVKMLTENPDLSIDDIDFEDHLIDNTNNPCVTAIIKELQKKDIRNALVPDLEGMGHLSQMVLDLFDHSKKYNLTFNIGQLNNIGSNVNGNTSGFDITLDTDLVKDATQLFIAKTVIHESLHAFIHYTVRENPGSIMTNVLKKYHTFYIINNPNNAGNLSEHQFMSQYVEALAYSLSSYDNHQQPMDYYKALSWAGLESSNAYNALPDKTNIEKIIENERLAKSDAKSTKCP